MVAWIHLTQDSQMAGSCENANEHLNSINNRVFLDWLSNYQILKKYAISSTMLTKSQITWKVDHEFQVRMNL